MKISILDIISALHQVAYLYIYRRSCQYSIKYIKLFQDLLYFYFILKKWIFQILHWHWWFLVMTHQLSDSSGYAGPIFTASLMYYMYSFISFLYLKCYLCFSFLVTEFIIANKSISVFILYRLSIKMNLEGLGTKDGSFIFWLTLDQLVIFLWRNIISSP